MERRSKNNRKFLKANPVEKPVKKMEAPIRSNKERLCFQYKIRSGFWYKPHNNRKRPKDSQVK